jgi:PAS domain S-box-containing protein
MRKEYNSKKYTQRKNQGKEKSGKPEDIDIPPLQSEEIYPFIFKYVPLGIGIATMDGTVLICNDVMCRLTGYSETELKKINLSITYRKSEDRFRLLQRLKMYGIARRFETQLKRNDGSIYDASLTAILLNVHDSDYILTVAEDITDRRPTEDALIKIKEQMKAKSHALEEAKIVIKYLLSHKEQEVVNLESAILSNVQELILPYLEKARQCNSERHRKPYLNLIEDNMRNIISPFIQNITLNHYNLTPKEIQVANLIKDEKTTKEIAELMHLSIKAIEFHRHNIRTKLGLKNKKANLQSFLLSLS